MAPLASEIGFADRLVVLDIRGLARHDDAAGLQHVSVIGEFEGQGGVLLNQQQAHLRLAVDPAHDAENLLHDERRQSE